MVSIAFLLGCEKEGTPVSVEDLYRASNLPDKKFNATLNGYKFETNRTGGMKINQKLSLSAGDDYVTFNISTKRFENGLYFGKEDSLNNVINYRDGNGVLFSTTKFGKPTQCVIDIVSFNQEKGVISGNFSGIMYDQGSDFEIKLEKGSFIEVPVQIPFLGEMNARVGSEAFMSENCMFSGTSSGGFVFETITSYAKDDTLSISITIEENISKKEFNFVSDNVIARYNSNTFSSNVFKNLYTSEAGVLTILKVDSVNKRVEGIFNFRARNFLAEEVLVTGGNFKAVIK